MNLTGKSDASMAASQPQDGRQSGNCFCHCFSDGFLIIQGHDNKQLIHDSLVTFFLNLPKVVLLTFFVHGDVHSQFLKLTKILQLHLL